MDSRERGRAGRVHSARCGGREGTGGWGVKQGLGRGKAGKGDAGWRSLQ